MPVPMPPPLAPELVVYRIRCERLVLGLRFVSRDVLYATSPRRRVVALDAATERRLWDFLAPESGTGIVKSHYRGVTYWEGGDDRRIFFTTSHLLYALD